MIKAPGKKVVCVVVFTGYEDGTVDFTQDAPHKELFKEVLGCFGTMIKHLRDTISNQAKCPFSPDNPTVYEYLKEDGKRETFK